MYSVYPEDKFDNQIFFYSQVLLLIEEGTMPSEYIEQVEVVNALITSLPYPLDLCTSDVIEFINASKQNMIENADSTALTET